MCVCVHGDSPPLEQCTNELIGNTVTVLINGFLEITLYGLVFFCFILFASTDQKMSKRKKSRAVVIDSDSSDSDSPDNLDEVSF